MILKPWIDSRTNMWTSFWFVSFQGEPEMSEENFPPETLEGMPEDMFQNESMAIILPTAIKLHSGLWRVCVYYEELGEWNLLTFTRAQVQGIMNSSFVTKWNRLFHFGGSWWNIEKLRKLEFTVFQCSVQSRW